MEFRIHGVLAAALVAALMVGGSAASAAPKKLVVNTSVVPPHLVSVLYMKRDLFKHAGKSYEVDFIKTRGSAQVLTAMAAREIDLGVLSSVAFA